MDYKQRRLVREKVWEPIHNDVVIEMEVEWIKRGKRGIKELLIGPYLTDTNGIFFYEKKTFNSTLMDRKCDLVFVDKNKKVIKTFKEFDVNKDTGTINDSKFLYVFREGFIKKHSIKKGDEFWHERKRG